MYDFHILSKKYLNHSTCIYIYIMFSRKDFLLKIIYLVPVLLGVGWFAFKFSEKLLELFFLFTANSPTPKKKQTIFGIKLSQKLPRTSNTSPNRAKKRFELVGYKHIIIKPVD